MRKLRIGSKRTRSSLKSSLHSVMAPQSTSLLSRNGASDYSQRKDSEKEGKEEVLSPIVLHKSSVQRANVKMTPVSSLPGRPTVADQRLIIVLRSVVLLLCLVCYLQADVVQGWVNAGWNYLLSAWWFQSVYFETAWATVTYGYLIPLYPFSMHYMPWLDRYKIDQSTTYVHQTVIGIVLDAVVYMAPLALMDTFMVKKYCGVEPQELTLRRQDWIQVTRALPLEPPTVLQLLYQVIGAVLIYDLLFFVLHLALHKYRPLYELLHAHHHDHSIMHAHVTNQLSVGERVMLILAANQALKILHSHPMSRALFVPVFIWLLIENHSGYDLPWALQHLVPAGLWGGPRLHFAHHVLGSRHYQPFMTYMDKLLERWEGRSCSKPC